MQVNQVNKVSNRNDSIQMDKTWLNVHDTAMAFGSMTLFSTFWSQITMFWQRYLVAMNRDMILNKEIILKKIDHDFRVRINDHNLVLLNRKYNDED